MLLSSGVVHLEVRQKLAFVKNWEQLNQQMWEDGYGYSKEKRAFAKLTIHGDAKLDDVLKVGVCKIGPLKCGTAEVSFTYWLPTPQLRIIHDLLGPWYGTCEEYDRLVTIQGQCEREHKEAESRKLAAAEESRMAKVEESWTNRKKDEMADSTFSDRSYQYGQALLWQAETGNYQVGSDGAPNWPDPPVPFQKGLCADGNRYPFFMPTGSPPNSLPPSPPGSPPPELVDVWKTKVFYNKLPDAIVEKYMDQYQANLRYRTYRSGKYKMKPVMDELKVRVEQHCGNFLWLREHRHWCIKPQVVHYFSRIQMRKVGYGKLKSLKEGAAPPWCLLIGNPSSHEGSKDANNSDMVYRQPAAFLPF